MVRTRAIRAVLRLCNVARYLPDFGMCHHLAQATHSQQTHLPERLTDLRFVTRLGGKHCAQFWGVVVGNECLLQALCRIGKVAIGLVIDMHSAASEDTAVAADSYRYPRLEYSMMARFNYRSKICSVSSTCLKRQRTIGLVMRMISDG
jgi:hypothetical protein